MRRGLLKINMNKLIAALALHLPYLVFLLLTNMHISYLITRKLNLVKSINLYPNIFIED